MPFRIVIGPNLVDAPPIKPIELYPEAIRVPGGVIINPTDTGPFKFTVNSATQVGEPDKSFALPLVNGQVYNFVVDWGDGSTDTITAWNQPEATHSYSVNGDYQIAISGTFPGWGFEGAGDCLKMRTVDQWGSAITFSYMYRAFEGCTSMTFIPSGGTFTATDYTNAFRSTGIVNFPAMDFSAGIIFTNFLYDSNSCVTIGAVDMRNGTGFANAFSNMDGLVSISSSIRMDSAVDINGLCAHDVNLTGFPALNLQHVTNCSTGWLDCPLLATFSVTNLSSTTTCAGAWQGCSALTSFPSLAFTACTDFTNAWFQTGLAAFPNISVASGAVFTNSWFGCSSMVSVGAIDVSGATDFSGCFSGCTALGSCGMSGGTVSIDYTNCALDDGNINTIFTNLGITATGTITVTGNPGAGTCDQTIATSKGWTVMT